MFLNLKHWMQGAPMIPVVRLEGRIRQGKQPMQLSFANTQKQLAMAFNVSRAKAVAIVINSPGGSPVQSHLIAQHIRQLRNTNKIPCLAFVEDAAASGGYMLALGCDEIYADPFSIIGSIGVISSTFGFNRAIDKLGVERRVTTAGENKSFLDPFQPQSPRDKEKLEALLQHAHEMFKQFVRDRRGNRLKENADDATLFQGEFWFAHQAKQLGLIDGIVETTVRDVLLKRFGSECKLIIVPPPIRGIVDLLGMTSSQQPNSLLEF